MSRFDRYLLSQLMVLFGFFSLVLILVYWINRAVKLFDQLIADGQSAWVFLEFTALSLPGVIRIVLPIAAVIASIYVANRMTVDSELTVMRATGFSSFRLARPVFFFGLIVTVLTMALAHLLEPLATRAYNLRSSEISQNVAARLLTEGQFLTPADGVTFYIRDISPDGELLDIFLSDTRSPRESVTYTAKSAFIIGTDVGPQLVMIEGMAQILRNEGQSLVTTAFEDFAYDIGALMGDPAARGRTPREMTTNLLIWPTPQVLAETGVAPDVLFAMAQGRIAEPLQAVIGALLGFSTLLLGGFSRFGVWRQITVAILLVIAIKMVETAAINTIREQPGLWALNYAPALFGGAIIWFQLFWATNPHFLGRAPRPLAKGGAA